MNGEVPEFRLQSSLDAEAAHAAFAGNGRVQLNGALDPRDATRLHESLQRDVPWQLHFNDGPRTHDIDLAQYEALDEDRREALVRALYANVAGGFQYLFCNFPVTGACEQGRHADLLVTLFQAFVNSEGFLGFARKVTGHGDICLADAQATRFEPGHFLTAHDDRASGKHRVAPFAPAPRYSLSGWLRTA